MIRRPCLTLLLIPLLSLSAHADKGTVTESRHPTAMETRRYRAKVVEEMESEGFRQIPRVPKIIGGGGAVDGEYPWMAALISSDVEDNYEGLFCGGSLIHPYWVLTAAHCVVGAKAEDIDVVLGATDLDNSPGAKRIAVAEIVVSPDFNDFTLDSDFALLRLAEPAPAGLPVLSLVDRPVLANPGVQAIVTGWGDTTDGDKNYPVRLQEVQVPIVDLAVANATEAYAGTLSENMLAAGLANGGKDSCSGDSGGPLIVPSPVSPGWMQAGVVSFGNGCGLPDVYGIYTRIGNFRHFITGHIRPNYAAWELAMGRSGETRDPDLNGFTNFQEFALPGYTFSQLVEGDFVRFSYLRPVLASEVNYVLENAPSAAGPWVGKSPSFVSFDVPPGSEYGLWTMQLPVAENTGVFRIRPELSKELARGPRPLEFPGGANGTLDETDEALAGQPNTRARSYRLENFPAGTSASVTLRSTDFDAQLELLNEETGDVIQTSNSGAAGGVFGGDEKLTFSFESGVRYLLRVSKTTGDVPGDFTLNVWDPVALAANPLLTVPATPKAKPVKGTLATTDAFDPVFEPGGDYYKDDFRLDTSAVPAGKVVEIRMKSKGKPGTAIDDFVGLIDAENGRFIVGNDNFAGKTNDAGLRFIPVPGKSYLLRASGAAENDVGTYTLSAAVPKLSGKTPLATLASSARAKGKLSPASEIDDRYLTFKRDYLVDSAVPGQEMFVTLSSAKFDAYLMVLNASTLATVTEADGGGPEAGLDDARAVFTPEQGHRYIIRATSYEEGEIGAYTIATGPNP